MCQSFSSISVYKIISIHPFFLDIRTPRDGIASLQDQHLRDVSL